METIEEEIENARYYLDRVKEVKAAYDLGIEAYVEEMKRGYGQNVLFAVGRNLYKNTPSMKDLHVPEEMQQEAESLMGRWRLFGLDYPEKMEKQFSGESYDRNNFYQIMELKEPELIEEERNDWWKRCEIVHKKAVYMLESYKRNKEIDKDLGL